MNKLNMRLSNKCVIGLLVVNSLFLSIGFITGRYSVNKHISDKSETIKKDSWNSGYISGLVKQLDVENTGSDEKTDVENTGSDEKTDVENTGSDDDLIIEGDNENTGSDDDLIIEGDNEKFKSIFRFS